MMRRAAVAGLVITAAWAAAQAPPRRQAPSSATAPAAATTPPVTEAAGLSLSAADAAELRADLARMQALIEQMERNLAFVDTVSSPMRHQFELELDMWRLVAGRMERKLRDRNKTTKP